MVSPESSPAFGRVTVAIPVYNGMPYLKAALASLQAQTYTDLDIVVIDNCSTDDTASFVRSVDDPRVRLIVNETNVGLEGNWNKALEQSSASPYWKLLCADDALEPRAIETELRVLNDHPNVVMTASRRKIVDDNDKTIVAGRGLGRLRGEVVGTRAVRSSVRYGTNLFGEPPSVMVRSSALQDIGRFDGTHHFCIDFDMWARVLLRGNVYAIRESLAWFRVGASSTSLAIARQQTKQVVGELRRLKGEPRYGITAVDLWMGIVLAAAQTEARMMLYRLLDWRDKRKKKA